MTLPGGIPWWMACIGASSFLVVVAVMIVWQVVQSRLEKGEEEALAAGRGIAPVTHPEPLHGWITMALAFLDNGSSWTTATAQAGQSVLADWGIQGVPLLDHRLGELAAQPHDAWNLLRALRMVLAARAAQQLDPAGCWGRARPIAQELQARYPDFESIAQGYLAGLRQWKRLPPDGSGDDAELVGFRTNLDRFRATAWNGVPYRAPI
jgi:hypothetical protein